ncbi:Uncharacterized protein APZ42_004576, partial [Daphnia magna]
HAQPTTISHGLPLNGKRWLRSRTRRLQPAAPKQPTIPCFFTALLTTIQQSSQTAPFLPPVTQPRISMDRWLLAASLLQLPSNHQLMFLTAP